MNVLPRAKQLAVVASLMRGVGTRETAKVTGVNRNTVTRIKQSWKAGQLPDLVAELSQEAVPHEKVRVAEAVKRAMDCFDALLQALIDLRVAADAEAKSTLERRRRSGAARRALLARPLTEEQRAAAMARATRIRQELEEWRVREGKLIELGDLEAVIEVARKRDKRAIPLQALCAEGSTFDAILPSDDLDPEEIATAREGMKLIGQMTRQERADLLRIYAGAE